MGHKESSDRRSKTRTRCGSLLIGITPIVSVPAADFTGPGLPLLDATPSKSRMTVPRSLPASSVFLLVDHHFLREFKRLRELASKGNAGYHRLTFSPAVPHYYCFE